MSDDNVDFEFLKRFLNAQEKDKKFLLHRLNFVVQEETENVM